MTESSLIFRGGTAQLDNFTHPYVHDCECKECLCVILRYRALTRSEDSANAGLMFPVGVAFITKDSMFLVSSENKLIA